MIAPRTLVAASIIVGLGSSSFAEGPPGASACSGCHSVATGVDTPVPRLAGRNAAELVDRMKAFRAGARPGTVMDRIAKGFTDPETVAIADWFSKQLP